MCNHAAAETTQHTTVWVLTALVTRCVQVLTLTGAPLVQRVVDVAVEQGAQEVVIGLPTRSVGALPGVVAERLVSDSSPRASHCLPGPSAATHICMWRRSRSKRAEWKSRSRETAWLILRLLHGP